MSPLLPLEKLLLIFPCSVVPCTFFLIDDHVLYPRQECLASSSENVAEECGAVRCPGPVAGGRGSRDSGCGVRGALGLPLCPVEVRPSPRHDQGAVPRPHCRHCRVSRANAVRRASKSPGLVRSALPLPDSELWRNEKTLFIRCFFLLVIYAHGT